jgi:hypothetical protein
VALLNLGNRFLPKLLTGVRANDREELIGFLLCRVTTFNNEDDGRFNASVNLFEVKGKEVRVIKSSFFKNYELTMQT